MENQSKLANTFCGTSNYMAPELIDVDVRYSFPVDIWSLGASIIEMIKCEFVSIILLNSSVLKVFLFAYLQKQFY